MVTAVDGRIDCAMTEQLQYYNTLLWDEPVSYTHLRAHETLMNLV